MRPQPLICVRNVEPSSRWYQRLLGCQSGHGGPQYERLVSPGGLILQLLVLVRPNIELICMEFGLAT
jgi:hypothetical protein